MLRALFPSRPEVRSINATAWGSWGTDDPALGSSTVTQTTAMQLLAVSGCVRLISDSISTLPIDVYRELPNGTKQEERPPAWLTSPTMDLDFTSWCGQVLTSLLLHGNAYVVVLRNGNRIVELMPVEPSRVQVVRMGARKVTLINGQEWPGEILHLKGMMLPGTDVGLSPLEYARQSISLGLEAQAYGADSFASSLNMPGVIEAPGDMDPTSIGEMARSWKRARSKRNRGLPGVLVGGATWKATGVTNEQAQFLQTRQWTAAEIAAQVYLVDPRELGIPLTGTTLEYTNAESRKADLLGKALLPWIVRIERALSGLLPAPRYVKFNVNAFLRADSAARWTQYGQAMAINATAAQIGQPPVLTTVEMREFEELDVLDEPSEEAM